MIAICYKIIFSLIWSGKKHYARNVVYTFPVNIHWPDTGNISTKAAVLFLVQSAAKAWQPKCIYRDTWVQIIVQRKSSLVSCVQKDFLTKRTWSTTWGRECVTHEGLPYWLIVRLVHQRLSHCVTLKGLSCWLMRDSLQCATHLGLSRCATLE